MKDGDSDTGINTNTFVIIWPHTHNKHSNERRLLASYLWVSLKKFPISKFLEMHRNGKGNARNRFLK